MRVLALATVTVVQLGASTTDWGLVSPQWTMYYAPTVTTTSVDTTAPSTDLSTSTTSSSALSYDFHYTGGVQSLQTTTQAADTQSWYVTAPTYATYTTTTSTALAGTGTSTSLQTTDIYSSVTLQMASQVNYLGMVSYSGWGAYTPVTWTSTTTTTALPPAPSWVTPSGDALGNPEPGTWVLMTTGLAGLIWAARRQRRA